MRTLLVTVHSKFIHPSLALPCLASFCGEECGEECGELLIREFTLQEPKQNILARLLAERPDIVAFSVYLWNRAIILELADALHAAQPALRIVLGGPEVSFDGEELFARHPGVTALVRGEGEVPFARLLKSWLEGTDPEDLTGLTLRAGGRVEAGPEAPPLTNLDLIPSPFRAGLVELTRGYVYLETSRGCPYRCAFCLSSRDRMVRSFSMPRIESDLLWLMEREVPQVKLVDRTFNYHPERARRIFRFILQNNRSTRFHFEIGAALLEEEDLELLASVPKGMFQFEIGVQTISVETLAAIDRSVAPEQLTRNVRALKERTRIHLHLDLVAGLPGERLSQVLAGIDRLLAVDPDHLQIEPVKLLPGTPLRNKAAEFGIRFDPNPPYTILASDSIAFDELERLGTISRLLDLTWNAGRLRTLFGILSELDSMARQLDRLAAFIEQHDLLRHPVGQLQLFELVWDWLREAAEPEILLRLQDALGRDFALAERVLPNRRPAFLATELEEKELEQVQRLVDEERLRLRGSDTRLQFFAAPFDHLATPPRREVRLFLYRHRSGEPLEIEERIVT